MKTVIKVSIILATYNRAQYIVESLTSIQNQIFVDWECLIIDDGGTDNTRELIAPILEADNRFQFYTRTTKYQKGLPGSRNYGLDLAKGDYIIFFDDDDIVHPQNLELCVLEMSRNDISFCRYIREVFFYDFNYMFDYSKEYSSFYIDDSNISEILRNELPFNSCAVMWKKECFKQYKFNESLMYAEEWELYSRIIASGFKGISIEKCLFYGRKHFDSNTGEFYNHNNIRRESYTKAILLVVENLKEKKLLTVSLQRYFISISIGFSEYSLFESLLNVYTLSPFEKIKWKFFYTTLPIRLELYRIKKKFKSKT